MVGLLMHRKTKAEGKNARAARDNDVKGRFRRRKPLREWFR